MGGSDYHIKEYVGVIWVFWTEPCLLFYILLLFFFFVFFFWSFQFLPLTSCFLSLAGALIQWFTGTLVHSYTGTLIHSYTMYEEREKGFVQKSILYSMVIIHENAVSIMLVLVSWDRLWTFRLFEM